jgi:hypothetical protein
MSSQLQPDNTQPDNAAGSAVKQKLPDSNRNQFNETTKELFRRIGTVLLDLIPEGITTIGLLGIIAISRMALRAWIGGDAKFFDYIKVSWVFDSGDITIILRFIWMSIKKFR